MAIVLCVDAVKTLFNSAEMRVYSGTRPDTPLDPLNGDNDLVATVVFGAVAFGPADGSGVCLNNAVASNDTDTDLGLATWARVVGSDGITVSDLDVGTSGSDLNVDPTATVTAGGSFVLPTGVFRLTQS